jgi:indolepyruvate ferredoxin oxidoreductase
MCAEGAAKTIVVTDEPEKYNGLRLAEGVTVHHRDELDALQRQFREIKGCSVIIYDQTCATEKRRRRKRGAFVDPAARVVINQAVCEGCGDCGVQSNCLSVEPSETEFGRKRQINQSTCNKDFSCVKGFCPSFVTVEGGQLKKKGKDVAKLNPFDDASLGFLPLPQVPALDGSDGRTERVWGIVIAGVGGTGVITIGQLLGMAAHLEGKGIVTQDAAGLAQKGGSTWSHVLISQQPSDICTTRVGMASADLIIGCDPIVAAHKETMLRMCEGKTHVALNAHSAPTAVFVHNGNWQNPGSACQAEITKAVGATQVGAFNADTAATQLMGDSIYANPMLLGYAWQKGWVPLSLASLMRAIELNAVAVEQNKAAFTWGRRAAHALASVEKLFMPAQVISLPTPRQGLDALVKRRVEFLTAYQNTAYAQRYAEFVARVAAVEAALPEAVRGKSLLSQAVAHGLFKLMSYKDEYEVARLHTDTGFEDTIKAMFEGDFKINYHLAPPLLSPKNDRGELQKRKFGPWMNSGFKVLAKLKGLRGTPLDVFGYSAERQTERALIDAYRVSMEEVLASLSEHNHAAALEIARIPEQIKGFGHVKERHLAAARLAWAQALQGFRLSR